MVGKPWQEVAKTVQDYRDGTIAEIQPPVPDVPAELPLNVTGIPKELLTSEEVKITESTTEDLIVSLASGQLSSETVVKAFLRRAGLAQRLTNCVTEVLPARALERAKYLDEYLATHKKPIGPLHGLPISVKDIVPMKGLGLNWGFISRWDEVGEDDAFILKLFWNAGCNFYVRTTQPQTVMHLETSSNLYGATVNPYNRNLTCGGSSGGEGALLGIKGSCLGIGSDIGGSIRSPAANCGVFGFRPTSYRLPLAGIGAPMLGQEQIVPVIGPMSTTLEGCKIFMKTLIDQEPWIEDPSLLPLPWKETGNLIPQVGGKKKLKIGVMWNDGVVKPHPPVTRALKELTEKLQAVDGVEIVDWKPYRHDLAWEIISSMYFCDGAAEDRAAIGLGEEPWRPLSKFIIQEQPGVKEYTVSELWKLNCRRDEYRADYAKVWNATATDGHPVDVILCPVGPGAAPPLDHSRYWGYTSQWNLLDYPAMVFPVTTVNQEKDKVEQDYQPMNEQDKWNYELYSPERYTDAPVSLQLVGRRYQDEKVFAATEYIQTVVGGLPLVSS